MNDSRIRKLFFLLTAGVDGCLIENPVDLLYLTGLSLSKGRLWISPLRTILFVDGRYYEKAKREAPCEVILLQEKNFVEAVGEAKKIVFDSAFCSYEQFLASRKVLPQIDWFP